MNKLDTSLYKDELVIDGSSVIWSVDDGLVHKRTFDFENDHQPIAQALFTTFSSFPVDNSNLQSPSRRIDLSPSHSTSSNPNRALVVVLKSLMHIIYLQGGSYIVHLPFPVVHVWPVPSGLVLERQSDSILDPNPEDSFSLSLTESKLPRLFTLSGPLEDFGMVTCNGSSLDPMEEILFISSQNDALCLTRNLAENRITLWHVSPDHQARKKVLSFLVILIASQKFR
jgi:Anaphase-promoting complex subunit 1